MKPTFGFVVEYVKNIKIARHFYVDILGLDVERELPTYIQFDTVAIASDAPMSQGAKQEIYWLIDDAKQSFNRLVDKAEICLPLQTPPFGSVFGIKDPDGEARYLLELASDRPSQKV